MKMDFYVNVFVLIFRVSTHFVKSQSWHITNLFTVTPDLWETNLIYPILFTLIPLGRDTFYCHDVLPSQYYEPDIISHNKAKGEQQGELQGVTD